MITTDPDGTLVASSPGGPTVHGLGTSGSIRGPGGGPRGPSPLMLALAYAPNFRELVSGWIRRPELLARIPGHPDRPVHPVASARARCPGSDPGRGQIRGSGWAGPAGDHPGRAVRRLRAGLTVGGDRDLPAGDHLPDLDLRRRPLLLRAWPSILFLVFMLPLPTSINGLISLPLQRIAATGSCYVLQLSGFWVIQ